MVRGVALWGSWGALGGSLGQFGVALGGCWVALGGSWGAFGDSWVALISPSLHCRPWGNQKRETSTHFLSSRNLLFFISLFFSFFAPSWPPLGLLFGAFWAPKLAQVRPKSPLEASFFPKVDFSKKRAPLGPQHVFHPKRVPKTTPNRPKIVPRRS